MDWLTERLTGCQKETGVDWRSTQTDDLWWCAVCVLNDIIHSWLNPMSVCVSLSRRILSRRNDRIQNNFQHFLHYFHIFKHWSGSAIRSLFCWWLREPKIRYIHRADKCQRIDHEIYSDLVAHNQNAHFHFQIPKIPFSFPFHFSAQLHTRTIVIVITLQMYSTFYEFQLPYHHRHHIACGQHQVFLLNPTPTFA